jgi:hypothetical protein
MTIDRDDVRCAGSREVFGSRRRLEIPTHYKRAQGSYFLWTFPLIGCPVLPELRLSSTLARA